MVKMPRCPRCGEELEYEPMSDWYCENCDEYFHKTVVEKFQKRDERKKKLTSKVIVLLVVLILVISSAYIVLYLDSDGRSGDKEVTIDDVSDMRELSVLEEVEYRYMSREEFSDRFANSSDTEGDEMTFRVLETLFLTEPGTTNVTEEVQEGYTDQVMGFYDEENNIMYVIEGRSSLMDRITLAHELTHALQDQHFDLTEYTDEEQTDSYYARHAVLEGDATKVMYDYIFSLSQSEIEQLIGELSVGENGDGGEEEMPYYLEKLMMFPYEEGYSFVSFVYDYEGWEGVNELYSSPPDSTEQILHPNKYFDEEKPIDVYINQTVANMTLKDEDVMGEFIVNMMMGHYIYEKKADRAADGWGGDRFKYFANETGHLSIFKIRWDDTGEADEFERYWGEWTDNLPEEYSEHVDDGRYRMVSEEDVTTIYHGSSASVVEEAVDDHYNE
ncbi:MAG: DUF6782 family putative metallopeptidase [Thermoplasmatota archaeon]